MDDILISVNELINEYESNSWKTLEKLRIMHRKLVFLNHQLVGYNVEFFREYNAIQYNHKGSVSSGKIIADEKVPELRISRKIMDSIDNVLWSMRSEISSLKKEM